MNMIEVKTADLIGPALDWAVAHAVKVWESAHELFPTMTLDPTFSGVEPRPYPRGEFGSMLMTCVLVPSNPFRQDPQPFCPSIAWKHGGPLLHKNRVSTDAPGVSPGFWTASMPGSALMEICQGSTPLVAGCRRLVREHLGNTVNIPAELVTP